MAAELIGTKGKVSALTSDRIRARGRVTATRGCVPRGTGWARGKVTAGNDGMNMVKNCIDRVLQVLKVAKNNLMGEDGGLGMDAPEMMMRLGGTVVGLELGTVQVPRVCVNGEP